MNKFCSNKCIHFLLILYKSKTHGKMNDETPKWLFDDIVNNSAVIRRLYKNQTIDNKLRGTFSQKKSGKQKWTQEELEELRKIKEDFIINLIKS